MATDQAAEQPDVDPGVSLLLNALRDVVTGNRLVLGDERSLAMATEAFERAVPADRRAAFGDELDRIGSDPGTDGGAADSDLLTSVAETVAEALERREVRLRLDHETAVPIADRTARLYTFLTTRDRSVLTPLDLPASASDGIDAAVAGAYERAATSFESAVEAAGAGTSAVTTRTLAGVAHHWAGNDDLAMDFVEEALHLETDALGPKCVGLAADHRFPEKFRDGKLGARIFLRRTQEVPETGSIEASLGEPSGANDRTWTPLKGSAGCQVIDCLLPDSRLRLRVEGTPTDFPVLVGYYVGLGVVDLEVDEIRGVEKILLSGPRPEDAPAPTETLWLIDDNAGS